MKRPFIVLAALCLLSVASAAPTAAAGKTIYDSTCAGCHGPKAQGGIGPSLKASAAWKDNLFKRALKDGKNAKGTALKPIMPKFPQLTDEQIKSIQMHLKTLTK